MISHGKIAGHDCTYVYGGFVEPWKVCKDNFAQAKVGRTRVVVSGFNHPNGDPIKFKSRNRAERHIRTMGKAK